MYVGGSTSGWELADPNASLHALGIATPSDLAASGVTNFGTTGYANTGYGNTGYGTGYGTTAFGTPATQFGAMGGGYVGGSWSPEPVGNNQILYGVYSGQGAVALPQAYYGQQATYNPSSFLPQTAATTAAPTTTSSKPAETTSSGGGSSTPAVDPAKAAADKAAADKAAADKAAADKAAADKKPATADKKPDPKPDPKPEPKTITVKSGDNLSALAAKHGTTVDKLYELNKGVIGGDKNLIKPGQVLKLP
jgi:LysM repeat protein